MTEIGLSDNYVVYLVECNDQSLYCGLTNDIPHRIKAHNNGTGAKYTRSRGPVKLVWTSAPMNHCAAARLECQIKVLSHDQKIEMLKTRK